MRPQNPSDLNNLKSHQSYYMALSRSATAEGTLILQGFDPRVIIGGCSGALRQEFQELELLDEITRLCYSRKLPETPSLVPLGSRKVQNTYHKMCMNPLDGQSTALG